MLGATPNPTCTRADEVLQEIAREIGRSEHFHPTDVAVFFGTPGKKVPDPFFGGEGPDRVGCTQCGACMTGCRVGAKNTLDQNYLYLAEKRGLTIQPETEVSAVRPLPGGGYRVEAGPSFGKTGMQYAFTADKVIFSGGVMGTVPLLLKMQRDPAGLTKLSSRLGDYVRTNSEALIGVISPEKDQDLSKGVAITSILHTDDHSHIEPVRYGSGSSFFRALALPHSPAPTAAGRLVSAVRGVLSHPVRWARALTVSDYAKHSQILLYMRTLEGTLSLKLGRSAWTGFREGLVTKLDDPAAAPKAFIQEATDLANRFAAKVKGVSMSLLTETLMGVPSTAHILGGCCMGDSPDTGVIDNRHRVFGYDGLYIIDGSAVSANPGVNPSLTITALAERAMTFVPPKSQACQSAVV
jgi:cholesterol oxidase